MSSSPFAALNSSHFLPSVIDSFENEPLITPKVNSITEKHSFSNGLISVLLCNARSICNKFNELVSYIAVENPVIIALTETWLNSGYKHFIDEFSIPGYNLFHKDRTDRIGGGVLMYIKNSHIISETFYLSTHEALYIKIRSNNDQSSSIKLILVYRPPNSSESFDVSLYNEIKSNVGTGNIVIMGDFNCPSVNWDSFVCDSEGNRLLTTMDDLFMEQLVNHPTRYNNILDLVFTNNPNQICDMTVGECLGTSDHRIIRFNILYKFKAVDNISFIPNYRKANFDSIRAEILSNDWDELLQGNDIERSWLIFRDTLVDICDRNIPKKIRRQHNRYKPTWFNSNIERLIGDKRRAYNIQKSTSNPVDIANYVSILRSVKKAIKTAKLAYEKKISTEVKSNPKSFYGYVNSKKGARTAIGPLITHNGSTTSDPSEMANVLNYHFHSVFAKSNYYSGNINHHCTPQYQYNLPHVLAHQTHKILKNISSYKSPGPDGILPRVLKEAAYELSGPITILANKSFELGVVPADWRDANVTPIFKKGDKKDPNNYRPISLTSVLCKVIETLLKNSIVEYLEKNNIIVNSQHGFRRARSCTTNLIEFYHKILSNYDNKIASDIIYLDLKKAFDRVSHKYLLIKLQSYGMKNLCNWVGDWLSHRRQRVALNGIMSDWMPVTSGVPQGSVLGPVLFLIYINDVGDNMTSFVSKFADDTKVGHKVQSLLDRKEIQNDLNALVTWTKKWDMEFNRDKCKVMHVGPNNPKFDYFLEGHKLEGTVLERDLGVMISDDLKFKHHVEITCKRANRVLGLIARSFSDRSPETIISLYKSLVRPLLEYAVQFWSPFHKNEMEKIERVQRRATKLIPSVRNMTYENRLLKLNLFSMEYRRKRGDLIELYKMLNGFSHVDVPLLFTFITDSRNRGHNKKLLLQSVRTDKFKFSFANRVLKDWNSLPSSVAEAVSVNSFKAKIDEYFGY